MICNYFCALFMAGVSKIGELSERSEKEAADMQVTLKEIAERTGLSFQTVGDVLKPGSKRAARYRPSTRQRVLEAAAELGYRPNQAARAMITGRFGCAALVMGVRPNRSNLPAALLRGIHDALAERGMHLTCAILPDEQLTGEGFIPTVLRQWMADGLLINYTDHLPPLLLERLRTSGIPVVWLNTKLPGDCVHPDDFGAGRRAGEHLLSLGHRRLGFVNFSGEDHYSTRDRRAGFAEACRQGGAPAPAELVCLGGTERERIERAMAFLRDERPSAVAAYGPTTATPVLFAAQALGLAVPRDVSLVSFAGGFETWAGLRITTLAIPEYRMGQAAVERLCARLDDSALAVPTDRSNGIPFGFVPGETCASRVV